MQNHASPHKGYWFACSNSIQYRAKHNAQSLEVPYLAHIWGTSSNFKITSSFSMSIMHSRQTPAALPKETQVSKFRLETRSQGANYRLHSLGLCRRIRVPVYQQEIDLCVTSLQMHKQLVLGLEPMVSFPIFPWWKDFILQLKTPCLAGRNMESSPMSLFIYNSSAYCRMKTACL